MTDRSILQTVTVHQPEILHRLVYLSYRLLPDTILLCVYAFCMDLCIIG